MANVQGGVKRPVDAAKHMGFSKVTLYRKSRTEPDFPKPVKLTGRLTVYLVSELDEWLSKQVDASRKAA